MARAYMVLRQNGNGSYDTERVEAYTPEHAIEKVAVERGRVHRRARALLAQAQGRAHDEVRCREMTYEDIIDDAGGERGPDPKPAPREKKGRRPKVHARRGSGDQGRALSRLLTAGNAVQVLWKGARMRIELYGIVLERQDDRYVKMTVGESTIVWHVPNDLLGERTLGEELATALSIVDGRFSVHRIPEERA